MFFRKKNEEVIHSNMLMKSFDTLTAGQLKKIIDSIPEDTKICIRVGEKFCSANTVLFEVLGGNTLTLWESTSKEEG